MCAVYYISAANIIFFFEIHKLSPSFLVLRQKIWKFHINMLSLPRYILSKQRSLTNKYITFL